MGTVNSSQVPTRVQIRKPPQRELKESVSMTREEIASLIDERIAEHFREMADVVHYTAG